MAGSSHTLTSQDSKSRILTITTTYVADDTNGSIPTLVVAFPFDVELLELEHEVGGTAITANSDLTAVDANGIDRLIGIGTDALDQTDSLAAIVFAATNSAHPVVQAGEPLTLTIANNIVNDATGTLRIRARRV